VGEAEFDPIGVPNDELAPLFLGADPVLGQAQLQGL